MSLVLEAKRVLAGWPYFSGTPQLLLAAETPQQLNCEMVALDTLACGFTRFTVQSAALAGAALDKIKLVADQLSRRLTYLLEPISPLETDALRCLVQMRSNPPAKEQDTTHYYELLVERSGSLTLCRFQRTVGQSRQIVPAHVTREVLLKLVSDFSAAAC